MDDDARAEWVKHLRAAYRASGWVSGREQRDGFVINGGAPFLAAPGSGVFVKRHQLYQRNVEKSARAESVVAVDWRSRRAEQQGSIFIIYNDW